MFEIRKKCYDLVHQVIISLDQAANQNPDVVDGRNNLYTRRRKEAYDVVDISDDEVFQTDLYDWYSSIGQTDRLLEIRSPFIVTYLKRKSADDIASADLLWRYYSQRDQHHAAASVQLNLAKSSFELKLDRRIQYLSRAKANANTYHISTSRPARQALLREISDLLDLANIQDDLLQRLKADERIGPERKPDVIKALDGPILTISEVSIFPIEQPTSSTKNSFSSYTMNTQTRPATSTFASSSTKSQITATLMTYDPLGKTSSTVLTKKPPTVVNPYRTKLSLKKSVPSPPA